MCFSARNSFQGITSENLPRRHFDAEAQVTAGSKDITLARASFSRRREHLVRHLVRNPRTGAIFSPEGPSRTGSRPEPPCRRRFLAGRPTSYGIPSETLVRASFSRQRAYPRDNDVHAPRSGVISTPERRSTATLTAPSTRPARQSLSPGAPLPTARPR